LEARDVEPASFTALDAEADELAAEVRRACHALPEPRLEDLFRRAYTGAHAQVEADERAYREHRDRLAAVQA
ncbi:MAG: hypothetical protein L0I76_10640, partial [Pseudonocardia sp.]|nr:hypothetical protein [Pseudonocardia sp.]